MYHVLRKFCGRECLTVGLLLALSLWRIMSFPVWLVTSQRGLPRSPDSDWYLNYAYALLENCSISLHVNDILYLSYNFLLAGLIAVFRDPVAVIYAQSLAASLAVVPVYLLGRDLFNPRTGVLAGLFYLYNWDVTLWATYLLSDSFFVSLLILCVYLLVRAMDSGRRTDRVVFVLAAVCLALFRPSGLAVVFVMLVYILSRIGPAKLKNFCLRHRRLLVPLILAVILAGGVLAWRHAFDGFIASFQYNVKLVLYNLYARGRIYDIPTAYDYFFRPDYTLDIMDSLFLSFIYHNWDAVCVLFFRRTVAFFGTWAWQTSFQGFGDYLYYSFRLLPALLFAGGTFAAIRGRRFGRAAILWWIVLAIYVFCILIFIDAMYRYRFPAMPFVGMVAAYGTDRLISGGFSFAARIRAVASRRTI